MSARIEYNRSAANRTVYDKVMNRILPYVRQDITNVQLKSELQNIGRVKITEYCTRYYQLPNGLLSNTGQDNTEY